MAFWKAVDWAEDPRAITITVLVLISAVLWIAAWSQMGFGDLGTLCLALLDQPIAGAGETAPGWQAGSVASLSAMWALMMAAMMLPAAAPVASVYARIAAREHSGARLALRTGLFVGGYLLLWAAFSIGLALAQTIFRDLVFAPLDSMRATPAAGAILLLVAGAYQFSPLKEACLSKCREPMTFLLLHWRDGMSGAFPIGLRHGAYCLGCCAALMGLMFVFGAMNLWWMALIAIYCVAEKIAPHGILMGRIAGAVLIAAGLGASAALLT